MTLDVFTDEFARDPYRHYELARAESAVQMEVQPNGMTTWLVLSYERAREVLADPRFSNNLERADPENLRRGGILDTRGDTTLGPAMILSDPPVHTRLRRLVSRAFTPRRVEGLRPRIVVLAKDLLDAAAPRGAMDVVADFAEPLPVTVICELLGLPRQDHGRFQGWMTAMLTTPTSPEEKELRTQGARALADYLANQVAQRQPQVDLGRVEDEQPDLLSALIRARDGEGRLSERELVGMMLQLLVAGYETTRNLIGNGMVALFEHPEQLRLLLEHPELLPSAIEELLRYDSPIPRTSYRVAVEDVELDGVPIPAGSLVSLLVGAANRDPERFPEPDRLDITRRDSQHLAFAHGLHYCLGAPLARMEAEVAIGFLVGRFPELHLAPNTELRWRRSSIFFRGLEALPVEFTARLPR